MGTRSLTVIHSEDDGEIVVMYRQFDGYPAGHGQELADFLKPITLVNGIPLGDTRKLANGMGCLAGQIVAHFKTGTGGFYLHSAGTRNCGEEFVYHVWPQDGNIHMRCQLPGGEGLFTGLPSEFDGKEVGGE